MTEPDPDRGHVDGSAPDVVTFVVPGGDGAVLAELAEGTLDCVAQGLRHDRGWPVAELEISIAAGDPGRVITLSGEADVTTVAQLSELVTAQLSTGTLHLTIDAAGLSYADSMSIRVLMLAARILKERGGALVVLRPQRPVARLLSLLGADQMIMIRADAEVPPEMGSAEGRS